MVKFNQKHLKWLRTLSSEQAWRQIVKDAAAVSAVDPEKFLQNFHRYPILKSVPKFVGGWAVRDSSFHVGYVNKGLLEKRRTIAM